MEKKKEKNSKLRHEPVREKFHKHFLFQSSKRFEQT